MINEVGPGAPYNQFSVKAPPSLDIALLPFFPPRDPIHPRLELIRSDGSFFGYMKALVTALRHSHFDIVHAHSVHVAAMYVLATALIRAPKVRSVFTMHTSFPNYKRYHKLLLLLAAFKFDQIVCCGNASCASLPGIYRFLARGRIKAIPNGVDVAAVNNITISGSEIQDVDVFTAVMVTRLIEVKNCDVAIEAFLRAGMPSARLMIIGQGPRRTQLEELVERLGARDLVVFKGLMPRTSVYSYLRTADLFISTSRVEGLPNAVLEAMAAGCPVTLSDIPPHREIALGIEGISLRAPDDIQGFAADIVSFQAMSHIERRQIGKRCKDHVAAHFSLEGMHVQYREVYETLTAGSVASASRFVKT